jgi:cell fate (sporulation/competence/biofilm development) regulator YlbF (YheA/YmcA/DUF963 family)
VQEAIQEKARDIGRLLSQTPEYAALRTANSRLSDDREAVTILNRLSSLEGAITAAIRAGREPTQEERDEYESAVEELQQKSIYQQVVAAQSNFERLMAGINEEIARGIESGEQSRIILP